MQTQALESIYRTMLRIRRFDEGVTDLFKRSERRGRARLFSSIARFRRLNAPANRSGARGQRTGEIEPGRFDSNDKVELSAQLHKLTQEADKQARRGELLELKAPQAGIVKELATDSAGAVLQPARCS
jgi:hypothetical protein